MRAAAISATAFAVVILATAFTLAHDTSAAMPARLLAVFVADTGDKGLIRYTILPEDSGDQQ